METPQFARRSRRIGVLLLTHWPFPPDGVRDIERLFLEIASIGVNFC